MKKPTNQPQLRALDAAIEKSEEDSRQCRLSFSSDSVVDMGWGNESLSHEDGAMRMGERQTSMPLLFNHDRNDILGVVEEIGIEENKGRATVRFANNERGEWARNLVNDGILRNVSFMYQVYRYEEDEERDCLVARDWEPYEISLVTVPADASVGVGRSAPEIDTTATAVPETAVPDGSILEEESTMEMTIDTAVQNERSRFTEISALCATHKIDSDKRDSFIAEGLTVDQARAKVLDIVSARQVAKPVASAAQFDQRDLRGYSVVKAIRASILNDWSKAGLEREVSEEIATKLGRSTGGFFMPTRAASDITKAGTGGKLVGTDHRGGDFIDLLREKSVVFNLGATVLSGLVGNVAIPRQTGGATTYWVAEDADVTNSAATFDQVTLAPKTIGALTSMSRLMLQQSSPDVEMLIRNDLAAALANGIDAAAFAGAGSGAPVGIENTSGVGSVSITSAIDFDNIIDLETAVASANADFGHLAYVAPAGMIGALKKLKSTDKQYIWYQNQGVSAAVPGQINGYDVVRSNNVSTGKVIFGNWNDLIVGEWGSIEILPNAYGAGFKNGAIEIRALQTVDIALRHAASFAVAA